MAETIRSKKYDLEERTLQFTKEVIVFVGTLPKTLANTEIIRQVVRSAGSVGANYIEANESLGKKDFAMKVKVAVRKQRRADIGFAWLN